VLPYKATAVASGELQIIALLLDFFGIIHTYFDATSKNTYNLMLKVTE
jgi:hypothetical protein